MLLKFQKRIIRNSIKEAIYCNLSSAQLSRIAISETNHEALIWHHDDEFEIGGEMYDVVSIEKQKDSIIYYCFLDKKESKINVQIDQIAKSIWGRSPLSTDFETSLVDFIQKVYPIHRIDFFQDNNSVSFELLQGYRLFCPQEIKEVLSPPPDLS